MQTYWRELLLRRLQKVFQFIFHCLFTVYGIDYIPLVPGKLDPATSQSRSPSLPTHSNSERTVEQFVPASFPQSSSTISNDENIMFFARLLGLI